MWRTASWRTSAIWRTAVWRTARLRPGRRVGEVKFAARPAEMGSLRRPGLTISSLTIKSIGVRVPEDARAPPWLRV